MKIKTSGIIIKTKLKNECVSFYKEVLNFEILFENDFLTCFSVAGNYLMIEPAEEISNPNPNIIIRINIENIREAHAALEEKNITAHYDSFEWGDILTFFDPSGTKIELKDSEKFEAQIFEYKNHNSVLNHSELNSDIANNPLPPAPPCCNADSSGR